MSTAIKIFKNQRVYIKYAIKHLNRSPSEAKRLLDDVVTSIVQKDSFDPTRGPLDFFVKMRMESRNKDNVKKQINAKNAELINLESMYSVHDSEFQETEYLGISEKEMMIDLINNPIKTYGNFKDQLIVTTLKPHNAFVGYAVRIRGLTNIDNLTIKRLSNKYGDDLYISEIVDKNNLIIKVNFDHDISPTSCGGNKAKIIIKKVSNNYQSNNAKYKLYEDIEGKKVIDIEHKEALKLCFKKFKSEEKYAFLLNLRRIKQRNLGEKISEPKIDNEGNSLMIGDIYFKKLPSSQQTKDKLYTFYRFNGTNWEDTIENPMINKPMSAEKITDLYNDKFKKNLSVNRIGEIIKYVKVKFGECVDNILGYAYG